MFLILFSFLIARLVYSAPLFQLDPSSLDRIASHLPPLDIPLLRAAHSKLNSTIFSYEHIRHDCGYEAMKLLDPSMAVFAFNKTVGQCGQPNSLDTLHLECLSPKCIHSLSKLRKRVFRHANHISSLSVGVRKDLPESLDWQLERDIQVLIHQLNQIKTLDSIFVNFASFSHSQWPVFELVLDELSKNDRIKAVSLDQINQDIVPLLELPLSRFHLESLSVKAVDSHKFDAPLSIRPLLSGHTSLKKLIMDTSTINIGEAYTYLESSGQTKKLTELTMDPSWASELLGPQSKFNNLESIKVYPDEQDVMHQIPNLNESLQKIKRVELYSLNVNIPKIPATVNELLLNFKDSHQSSDYWNTSIREIIQQTNLNKLSIQLPEMKERFDLDFVSAATNVTSISFKGTYTHCNTQGSNIRPILNQISTNNKLEEATFEFTFAMTNNHLQEILIGITRAVLKSKSLKRLNIGATVKYNPHKKRPRKFISRLDTVYEIMLPLQDLDLLINGVPVRDFLSATQRLQRHISPKYYSEYFTISY